MKPIIRNVGNLDGRPIGEDATGANKAPTQHSPTAQSLRGSPLTEIAGTHKSGRTPEAGRADTTRAGAFRYADAASDKTAGTATATNLLLAASTVRNVDNLRDLISNLVASAKASAAAQSEPSLEAHCEVFEKAADRVVHWTSWNQQVAGLRELRLAFRELPPEVGQTRLGSAINAAHEKAINSRATYLANQIESAEDLRQVLGTPLLGQDSSWPDSLRELAHAAFLEAVADRLKTLPPDQVGEWHQVLSEAIVSSPPWVAYSADEKLMQLEAHDLLPPDVRAEFEAGERLEQAAGSVHDIADLHALLAEPGILGFEMPDGLLGLVRSEHDGNLGLQARRRPEPLAVAATLVGSFTSKEANHQAFDEIFAKVDSIEPPGHRIASLMALAGAASRLGDDPARGQAYNRVLNNARTLREKQQITSQQYALVRDALHRAVQTRQGDDAGPAEQSALDALRQDAGARSRYGLAA
jgi:hypothetical protein